VCKECTEEICFEFVDKRSVKERTLIELLNTMTTQQGVLENKFPRGHLYPFKERKGQGSLRSEYLKLKEENMVAKHSRGRPVQGMY
jgi:hypothetical protein